MKVVFSRPSEDAPAKLLAEVELVDILPNLKLTGFAVWTGEKGAWVSFPSRKQGNGKFWDFLRSTRGDVKDAYKLKDYILKLYNEWNGRAPSRESEDEANPFA